MIIASGSWVPLMGSRPLAHFNPVPFSRWNHWESKGLIPVFLSPRLAHPNCPHLVSHQWRPLPFRRPRCWHQLVGWSEPPHPTSLSAWKPGNAYHVGPEVNFPGTLQEEGPLLMASGTKLPPDCPSSASSATLQKWGGKLAHFTLLPREPIVNGSPSQPCPKPVPFLCWLQKVSP